MDKIVVSAPTRVSDEYIEKLVKSKEAWINTKLKELKEKYPLCESKNFIDRKHIPYLGKDYDLHIQEELNIYKCTLQFKDNKFIACIPRNKSLDSVNTELQSLAINLIIDESMNLARQKVMHYSTLLNVFPKKIQIKDQRSSWGTCSSLGNIYLNYRIFLAPTYIVDYVIVHELCHLRHMNHSKDFWNLVSSIYPNYNDCRKWLKENGNSLNI